MDAHTSLDMLETAQRLAETGRHAAVVEQLGKLPVIELQESPTLALLFGIAEARLGRRTSGQQWVNRALEAARARGDPAVEARALNVSGAIAFETGHIEDATQCFTRALAAAEQQGDRATVGRCSNNLGIIANLRGQYGRAVGSYTMALAAFQQVGYRTGVAEVLHNLAIAYREQGDLAKSLEAEERAGQEAAAIGNTALVAKIQGGRAEVSLLAGDPELAFREVTRALDLHREVSNVVGEAEDLRVLAGAQTARGQAGAAETTLRDVIARARTLELPLLAAQAEWDLARLLYAQKQREGAEALAVSARERFERLGALVEVRHIDEFLNKLTS